MKRTDAPKKQPVPFGVNGQREDLLSTTPAGDNTASYNAGFPAVTMILKAAGGLPPKGQDMNQILFELSSLARWFSAGAMNSFDSSFSSSIGGYPMGATILGADGVTRYLNTIESNTSNPDSGGIGWFNLTSGYLQTGNNLSEIAAAGTAAQSSARANIAAAALAGLAAQVFNVAAATAGSHAVNLTQLNSVITTLNLGSASTRTVGTGTNQIPDMNAFNLNSIQCFRLPTGHIVQVGSGATNSGGFTQSYQVPFPNQCLALIGTVYGTLGQRLFTATNTSDRTAANMNVVDMNGNGATVSVGYIAIGR